MISNHCRAGYQAVLDQLNIYFQKLLKLPERLIPSAFHAPGFCCLNIQPEEVIIAYINIVDNLPQLQFCRSLPYEKPAEIKPLLTQVVKENHLENVSCSWILRHQDYQLISTEALPVTSGEFQTAIRWKIKDLLSYPIQDAVIESFSIPEPKIGDTKTIRVVAARESFLNVYARIINECGLKLTTIDIPELALRNITALYENDEKSTSLIYLRDQHVDLIITHKKALYFSRRLDFGLDKVNSFFLEEKKTHEYLDKLSLEIQRSFDYYQTQWRIPSPTRIFLATKRSASEKIIEYLSQHLSLPIESLDIMKVMACKEALTLEEQGSYLFVIGGVLRKIEEHHETTD